MSGLTETTLEQTALDWFESLGRQIAFVPDISPNGSAINQEEAGAVMLENKKQLKPFWSRRKFSAKRGSSVEAENRNPTPDEKKILAQYVGCGLFHKN